MTMWNLLHAPGATFVRLLLLVALAIAIGAAALATAGAEYFDSSLRGPQDANAFGVPVLASIPHIGPRRTGAGR